MKLMTKAILHKIPALYVQDGKKGEAVAHVKFFDPTGSWTWYGTEYDGQDTFFGLVDGQEKELGYFSLAELKSVRCRFGLGIERDLHFKPTKLKDIAPEMWS